MKILQIAHRLPWPPIDGGKKGLLGIVEGISSHAKVDDYSFICICPDDEGIWADEWQEKTNIKVEVHKANIKNKIIKIIWNTFFSSLPFNMKKYIVKNFAYKIKNQLMEMKPDIIHFDSLHTAYYVNLIKNELPDSLCVLRCHNSEHMILQRLVDAETNPLKKIILNIQSKRLKKYEAVMLDKFDLIIAITEDDARRFRDLNPNVADNIIVMPAGVDLPKMLPSYPIKHNNKIRLVHIAAMDWLPNIIGLRWFLCEVIPLLDNSGIDYQLDIVGKSMPDEFITFQHPRVSVHGFLENLDSVTSQSHIAIVPLQVGSGMRIKILDYWALGIPVISTKIGAEGLTNVDDQQETIVIANSATEFSKAIVDLSQDLLKCIAIRNSAFNHLQRYYGWPKLIDKLVCNLESRVIHK